jgi:hypothetical protein
LLRLDWADPTVSWPPSRPAVRAIGPTVRRVARTLSIATSFAAACPCALSIRSRPACLACSRKIGQHEAAPCRAFAPASLASSVQLNRVRCLLQRASWHLQGAGRASQRFRA